MQWPARRSQGCEVRASLLLLDTAPDAGFPARRPLCCRPLRGPAPWPRGLPRLRFCLNPEMPCRWFFGRLLRRVHACSRPARGPAVARRRGERSRIARLRSSRTDWQAPSGRNPAERLGLPLASVARRLGLNVSGPQHHPPEAVLRPAHLQKARARQRPWSLRAWVPQRARSSQSAAPPFHPRAGESPSLFSCPREPPSRLFGCSPARCPPEYSCPCRS